MCVKRTVKQFEGLKGFLLYLYIFILWFTLQIESIYHFLFVLII